MLENNQSQDDAQVAVTEVTTTTRRGRLKFKKFSTNQKETSFTF